MFGEIANVTNERMTEAALAHNPTNAKGPETSQPSEPQSGPDQRNVREACRIDKPRRSNHSPGATFDDPHRLMSAIAWLPQSPSAKLFANRGMQARSLRNNV
jgi:hypothetical protein